MIQPPTSLHLREVAIVEITGLFRFLILSILHGVVDMAQHVLDRIRVRQIERKERHQWMVLYQLNKSLI